MAEMNGAIVTGPHYFKSALTMPVYPTAICTIPDTTMTPWMVLRWIFDDKEDATRIPIGTPKIIASRVTCDAARYICLGEIR
jgi:hypothetical protein